MNVEQQQTLQNLVCQHQTQNSRAELAIGHLRYEALRRLSPLQFTSLCRRNLAGERFDDMVDELVLDDKHSPYRKERT